VQALSAGHALLPRKVIIMVDLALPLLLMLGAVLVALEHFRPAHAMEPRTDWYVRAVLLNVVQLFIFYAVDQFWTAHANQHSLRLATGLFSPLGGALLAYFVFTFFIYWWHRARHASPLLWRIFHQLHHSPRRIQTLTAYYIHPLDMLVGLSISNIILFPLLGLDFEAAAWYTLITGFAGFYIHSNLRVPRAVGYVFQTPEMHRLHHKSGHHAHNYSDIVLWDWMFGTYLNPTEPIEQCGFEEGDEHRFFSMLFGHDLGQEAAEAHGNSRSN
jgi:sterol desaturase/sphingolipid hydroxylase (fatty acid hydroxylase superfamily)